MDDTNQFLLKKIGDVETKLENHILKIEQRLDTIVSIMQQVTMLQERESRNSDDIKELKETLKDTIGAFNNTVQRVHVRLDEIEHARANYAREYDMGVKDVESKIMSKLDTFKKETDTTHQILNSNTQEIDMKVSRWMNRGIGIWTAASIFVVILQALGGFLLSNLKDDYQGMKSQVGAIERRLNEMDQTLTHRITENDQNVSTLWQELKRTPPPSKTRYPVK